MLTKLFTFFFIGLSFNTLAQQYILNQSPTVIEDNRELRSPWAGGLNSAQINMLDINQDGREDILALEKSTEESFIFLATATGTFKYSTDYGSLLPDISGWVLTRDFNGDGKKDIFTSDPLGIRLYINRLPEPFELYPEAPLLTKGILGNVNIYASEQDLPAIEDVDGDGDLDIVTMQFAGITLEYNKNMQVENGLINDTLVFERANDHWGDIKICDCKQVVGYEENCPENGGRVEHAGGHSLLLFDFDGDNDLDLTFSDRHCFGLSFHENLGSRSEAKFATKDSDILQFPVNVPYPVVAYEDVDHDGNKDFILSPVNSGTFNYVLDYSMSVWYFKNHGSTANPDFNHITQNFLQNDMIDVGMNSTPFFYDIDNDGDQDMFLGQLVDFSNNFLSGISYYKNTGSYGQPVFELVTSDAFGLSRGLIYNIKGQFFDITGDRRPEFIYSATSLADGNTAIYYLENTGLVTFNTDHEIKTAINSIPFGSNFYFHDLNQDGRPEMLLTSANGVQHWEKMNGKFVMSGQGFNKVPINTNDINIADLDADGNEDLVYATTGQVFAIYDFRNNDVAIQLSMRYNTDKTPDRLGQLVSIRTASLLGKDAPELVMGSNTGGLKIFSNSAALDVPEEDPFVLFPNPLDRNENLKFRSSRNLLMYIVSADGKTIMGPDYLPADKIYEFQPKALGQGLYVVYALVDEKTSWHRKFIVVD